MRFILHVLRDLRVRLSHCKQKSDLDLIFVILFKEGVKELCKTNGVKLSLRDHNDQTPLHSCCAQGHLEACKSEIHIFGSKVLPGIICKNTNMNILVKVMLQHRVSVTCVDKIGRVRFKLEKEK